MVLKLASFFAERREWVACRLSPVAAQLCGPATPQPSLHARTCRDEESGGAPGKAGGIGGDFGGAGGEVVGRQGQWRPALLHVLQVYVGCQDGALRAVHLLPPPLLCSASPASAQAIGDSGRLPDGGRGTDTHARAHA
eukprot:3005822-Rhodomonas_salina.1